MTTTVSVTISFDTVATTPDETATQIALLLAGLGVVAPHDVVVVAPAKARKERAPLTEEQKQVIRDRFAKGKADAQAKREALAAKSVKSAKPADDKPVGGNAADKARERVLNNAKEAHKGVRPQPAPKK